MSARRIEPMPQPDNQPSRRRPPEDEPPPAPTGRDLTPVPDTPDSASKLASTLARSGEPDTTADERPGDQTEPKVPLSALTNPPPVDPELDLVNLGVRVPRYLAQAVRTQAFLTRRSQQDIVLAALRGEQPLSPELLDECRRSATRTRR